MNYNQKNKNLKNRKGNFFFWNFKATLEMDKIFT